MDRGRSGSHTRTEPGVLFEPVAACLKGCAGWLAVAACLLAFARIASAQQPPVAAQASSATDDHGQHDETVSIASLFHADDNHLLVLHDPLPHLKALLTNRALGQAFKTGALAAAWTDDDGRAYEPLDAWNFFNTNARWVPQEVAIGISDKGIDDVDRLLRMLSLYELLYRGLIGDPDDARLDKDVAALRSAIAEDLASVTLPQIRVFARFRTPEQASAALEMVRNEVGGDNANDLPKGLSFEPAGKALVLKLRMADYFGNDDAEVLRWLKDLGLTSPRTQTPDATLTKALKSFTAEATLERAGDGLLLTLGPTSGGGAAGLAESAARPAAAVGAADDQTLAWFHWSDEKLAKTALSWLAFHDKWSATAVYAEPLSDSLGYDTLIDTVRTTASRLSRLSPSGSGRIWTTGDSLRVALLEEGVPAVPAVSASGLATLIPADADMFSIESATPMSALASDLLIRTEDNLLLRRLRPPPPPPAAVAVIPADGAPTANPDGSPDRDGNKSSGDPKSGGTSAGGDAARPADPGQPQEPVVVVAEPADRHRFDKDERFDYFKNFARLRDAIDRQSVDWFEGGSGLIVGNRGQLDRLELSVEIEGRPRTLSVRGLATPEFAVFGKLKGSIEPAAARERFESVAATIADGLRSTSRGELFLDRPFTFARGKSVELDLGLGSPAWGFDHEWLRQSTGEAKLRMAAEGNVQVHGFLIDGYLVVSTSPDLSRRIISAHNKPSARLRLPESPLPVVGFSRFGGEATSKTLDELAGWVRAYTQNNSRADNDASNFLWDDVESQLQQLAQIVRLAKSAEAITTQASDGTTRMTHWRIDMNEP